VNASKPLNVYHGGQRYGGWWEVDGKELLVSSAYGSKRAPLGRRKPEKVAEELLLQIVKERRP
jgi:hypothetical protein